MVTYEDCLALAGLTPEEADHVAAREHLPAIVALGFASHLARTAEAERSVRRLGGRTGADPARIPGPRVGRLAA
jgi:hypothetical protein